MLRLRILAGRVAHCPTAYATFGVMVFRVVVRDTVGVHVMRQSNPSRA